MKTSQRIPKAIAVVVILGLGMLYNAEKENHILMQSIRQVDESRNNSDQNDPIEKPENKLFVYTKTIIKNSIQHLIFKI